MIRYLILIGVVLLLGCSKQLKSIDCTDRILKESNMVEYNGQPFECNNFIELFRFRNKQYFVLGNHCADMIVNPIDCNGNTICNKGERMKCNKFFENAVNIGVIGIQL